MEHSSSLDLITDSVLRNIYQLVVEEGYIRVEAKRTYITIYKEASREIQTIKSMLDRDCSPAHCRMIFGYAYSVMESALYEMLKSLVINEDSCLKNAVSNITNLKDVKITLAEWFDDRELIVSKVMNHLHNNIMYHNIQPIYAIYRAVLTEPAEQMQIEDLCKFTVLRHHIVHRNGKDLDGKDVTPDTHKTKQCVEAIEVFLAHLRNIADSVLKP